MNVNRTCRKYFSPEPILTVGEQISAQFVQAMVNGTLKPYDKLLSEKNLAAQFGVSRKTIRDGLLNLQMKGLIKSSRGKMGGSYIQDFPYSKLAEILGERFFFQLKLSDITLDDIEEVRKLVEVYCARKAADAYGSSDGNIQPLFEENSLEVSFDKKCNSFFNLHLSIGKASGNHILAQIVNLINLILSTVFVSSIYPSNAKEEAYAEHEELYNAIISGDQKRAESEMLVHILRTNQRIRTNRAEK